MYCKAYCTVTTIILPLASDSVAGLEKSMEKPGPSIPRKAAADRARLFAA